MLMVFELTSAVVSKSVIRNTLGQYGARVMYDLVSGYCCTASSHGKHLLYLYTCFK